MSIDHRRLRKSAHSHQLDIAAFTTMLVIVGSWLMFWFGD